MAGSRAFDIDHSLAFLRSADPVLATLIEQVGPIEVRPRGPNAFQALSRSIIYQQLSGTAAGAIYRKFQASFDLEGDAFPAPEQVLPRSDDDLRAAGLSRQKIASIRSLSEHFASGELGSEQFEHWEDDEIIAHLTRVRGVGRWTAEMFLMFHLRRPDVLPVNDLGINRAIMKRYGLEAMPKPDAVKAIGEPWRPHATVACLYLWRSEDVKLP
jgi:3-methyladenine DNA glycosylase/8-oxoguanine DNA glycosylase